MKIHKPPTNIYFIRHAETKISTNRNLDVLSEKGRHSLVHLNAIFQSLTIDWVFSSPYIRAVQTVEGIAKQKKIPIIELNGLREREVANIFIEDFDGFAKKQWLDFNFKLEGGESLNDVQKRAVETISGIVASNMGQNIIIGTHGTFLTVYLNSIDKKYDYQFWKQLKRPSIYVVSCIEGETEVTHLEI